MKTLAKPKSMTGFGWTRGRQGGIGYPPLIVFFRRRWHRVEGSEQHGGTVCRSCNGEPCLREYIDTWPYAESRVRASFGQMPVLSWNRFAELVRVRV